MSIFESFYNKMQEDPQKTINNVVKIDKPNLTYSYESRLKPLADVWSTKPIQYPVYIKWFEPQTEEKESLIYFNEPVHIKHDVLNKIMSVVNDKNQCLFITHQNNVEYIHVGSQPPVYLAKHMNIPVEKKESAFCDGYACAECSKGECKHTIDLTHAANFEDLFNTGKYEEKIK